MKAKIDFLCIKDVRNSSGILVWKKDKTYPLLMLKLIERPDHPFFVKTEFDYASNVSWAFLEENFAI